MIYIILSIILYTVAILLGAVASRNANSNLVSGIMNIFSALIPIAVAIPLLTKKVIVSHKLGVYSAILAGIAIALFTMALNKSYSENKVGIVAPAVFGGAILFSTLLSIYFFGEKVTFIQGLGLAFVGLGLITILYAKAIVK